MKILDRAKLAFNVLIGNSTKKEIKKPYIYANTRSKYKHINFNSLFQIYRESNDIKSCVREIRENVGSAGYTIRNKKTKKENTALKNEIDKILNWSRSNEIMTWDNLKRNTWKDLSVCDNAFWFLVRNIADTKVLGVERLDPRTMSIVADNTGSIFAYIQKNLNQEAIIFAPEEIIHFKTDINNDNELFGESPMTTLLWDALSSIEGAKANYSFFLNDARPNTVFILEDGMSEDERNIAIDAIQKQLKGSKNSGKSMTLEGVKEIITFDISRKDMQYLEGRGFSREAVCQAYGVPQFLLGITEKVNNNNGVELREQFYKNTIKNKEDLFAQQITIGLLERIGVVDDEFVFKNQIFNIEAIENRARDEYNNGLITLEQYYKKTFQEPPEEVKNNPIFKQLVIKQGSGAILSEDVGIKEEVLTDDDINNIKKLENA